jgi:hypothetical protein
MVIGRWLVAGSVLAAAPLPGQGTPPPPSAEAAPARDIVVVGSRIPDFEKVLDACLAEHCAPDKDIAATLALAQAQFEAGTYDAARASLLAARRRNARFAKQYPVAVANLHHANGVIAGHLGLADAEWSSALDTVSAIKAGTAEDDPRVFLERIELGDAYARAGRFKGSEMQYAGIARRAHKLGLVEIEGLALLRIATLNTRLAEQNHAMFASSARQAIDALLARREPALQPYQVAAGQLSFLLAAQTTPGPELDRLVAQYPRQPAGAPARMLYAPAIALTASPQGVRNGFGSNTGAIGLFNAGMPATGMDSYVGQWIDVAFTIGADGRISDAHISRSGDRVALKKGWAEQVVRAISVRRYAPQAQPSYGRERYTFTANLVAVTGSRLQARDPTPRLVRADLGPETTASPTASDLAPAS